MVNKNKSAFNYVKTFLALGLLLVFTAQFSLFAEENQPAENLSSSGDSPQFSPLPQVEASSFYLTETEEGERKIIQKLVWDADEYALFFEVVVQKQNEKGSFEEIAKEKCEQNFIELSLSHGIYRYKIYVYNILGRLENESEWVQFEIIKAILPDIYSVSPSIIYLEEENDGLYYIGGENLLTTSEYAMQAESGRKIYGQLAEHSENDKNVTVKFDLMQLNPSNYTFVVTNKGGLFSKKPEIVVKYKKIIDFDVFGGYSPILILADDTLKTYLQSSVLPISGMAGCTFVPFKRAYGYFGIGLLATYSRLFKDFSVYKIDGNLINAFLNVVYQKTLIKGRLVLDVHGGVGVSMFNNVVFHFPNGIDSEPALNAMALAFDGGVGFQFYMTKRLYTEARLNASFARFTDATLLLLNPAILIGWQF